MEVLNNCAAHLSNYEVLNALQDIKNNRKQKAQKQLATITYQTIRYLEETPCKTQTPEKIRNFLKDMQGFKLTKCEKLGLLNLCPKSAVEVQLIIEDTEERFTDEEVESLLQVIANHVGDEEEESVE